MMSRLGYMGCVGCVGCVGDVGASMPMRFIGELVMQQEILSALGSLAKFQPVT